ncbi:MAG: OsmC family protein [Chitinivibrionales bacterium]|nr:OsmC family protein [Chitinivibrionales bacterium]
MPTRIAEAQWTGTLSKGKGNVITGSGLTRGDYSFASRFESGSGTNPEELLGAAHAACFSMAFAMIVEQAGFTPEKIHTVARVTIEKGAGGFSITGIVLQTEAKIKNIDEKTFQEKALEAKNGCPVSRALASTPISVRATLLK